MRIWNYISQAFLAPRSLTSPPIATDSSSTSLSSHSAMSNTNVKLYFGYGSNLWRHQMEQRCPQSEYLGVARLNNYAWLINERGYANIKEVNNTESNHQPKLQSNAKPTAKTSTTYSHQVYGLVYSLSPSDERRLDRNEGVPYAYTKETLKCDFWPVREDSGRANLTSHPARVKLLVYINRDQVEPSEPKEEYVYRMNMGIRDALEEGVPRGYVEEVMRKFIPPESEVEVEDLARKQAVEFEDEE